MIHNFFCEPWLFFLEVSWKCSRVFQKRSIGSFSRLPLPPLSSWKWAAVCFFWDSCFCETYSSVFFNLISLMDLCFVTSHWFFCVKSCRHIWIELITMLQMWQHLQHLRGLVSQGGRLYASVLEVASDFIAFFLNWEVIYPMRASSG